MIHELTIHRDEHTFLFRYTLDRIGELQQILAINASRGNFTFDQAFEANRQILKVKEQHGMDMEAIKLRWTRAGFSPAILGNENEWQVTLYHSFPSQKLHRPPTGRGNTLKDAFDAAEADLGEMLAKAKV